MATKDRAASAAPDVDGPALVAMVRDPEFYPAPCAADVHPDEVENYRAGGWTEA